jgi:putative chitinase
MTEPRRLTISGGLKAVDTGGRRPVSISPLVGFDDVFAPPGWHPPMALPEGAVFGKDEMHVLDLQIGLLKAGFDCGALDGVASGDTWTALTRAVASDVKSDRLAKIGQAMARHFPAFQISTRLRVIHFFAQAAHETGGFRYMQEIGGPSYFSKYDGRADLKNTEPGDGARFHGRGIFQLTGRGNYITYGNELGVDLVAHPDLAADPATAVELACLYWKDRGLNALADADNTEAISIKINGGNSKTIRKKGHLAERLQYVALIKQIWALPSP